MDEYDQSVIFADDNGAPLGGETGESVSPDRDDIAEQNTAADSGENADRQDAAAEDTAPEAEAETDRFTLKHLDEVRTVSRDEVIVWTMTASGQSTMRSGQTSRRAPDRSPPCRSLPQWPGGSGAFCGSPWNFPR